VSILRAARVLRPGWPRRRRSMLLDVREGDGRRGYHAMAALTLMAPHLGGVQLGALTSGHPDEGIALAVFRFDTGLDLPLWPVDGAANDGASAPGRLGRRMWSVGADRGTSFDLYAIIADEWPDDAITAAAGRSARRTLLGLAGPAVAARASGILVVDGNDTRMFAARALSLLGRRFPSAKAGVNRAG
jgi:hypothetical protein